MSKSTKDSIRITKNAAMVAAPQNIDQANEIITRIGTAERKIRQIENGMNVALATVKLECEEKAAPWRKEIADLTAGLKIWCDANRRSLTQDGRKKTADLPAGKIGWRMRPPRCLVRDTDEVIAHLHAMNLERFLRHQETVNKEALLGEAETARKIPGITILQEEDFFVQPFSIDIA